MQKPTGKTQNSIRGMEPRAPRDSGSASVSRDPVMMNQAKSTRKSSAEINRTVNAFVHQANNMAINGFSKRNDGGEERQENSVKSKPNHPVGKTTPRQIVEMQGGYVKSRQPPPVQSKITSGTNGKGKPATISFAKNAEPTSGILRQSDLSSTVDISTKKPGVQKARHKDVRISGGVPSKGNRVASDVNRSTGHGVNTNYSIDETSTHRNTAIKSVTNKAVGQKSQQAPGIKNQALVRTNSPNERIAKTDGRPRRSSANRNRLDYYTSSSSDDECTRPPKGPNAPLSPASKAKMWNDINKSPGPTYPGWKFRSPPEGRHLSQIGPEELSAMFKNMKMEAQSKTEDPTPKGPSKFSDYMRKMKTSSRAAEEMSEDSLQQNIELKKMYAEQLDAMQQRAWDSLQALDANMKKNTESGLRTSFDKFMEGTSRIPNRITVAELAKSRGGNFKGKDNPSKKPLKKSFAQGDVVQAEDFSSDESDMMSPPSPRHCGQPSARGKPRAKETIGSKSGKPTSRMEQMLEDIRSTRRNLAQGDVLQTDSDAVSSADSDNKSNPRPRPRRLGDTVRSGANARMKPPDESRSLSPVTADQFKSLAEKDPLTKLKKISEQLKLDNAKMLSRRAPHAQAIKFSSSEYESDSDVPCNGVLFQLAGAGLQQVGFTRAPGVQYTTPYHATPRARYATTSSPNNFMGIRRGYVGNTYSRNRGRYSYPRRQNYYDDDSDDDYYYNWDYDNDYADLDIVDFD